MNSNQYNCSIFNYDHSGNTANDGISTNAYDGVSICAGSNSRNEVVRVSPAANGGVDTGRVGIGTTSPAYKLDLSTTQYAIVRSLNVPARVCYGHWNASTSAVTVQRNTISDYVTGTWSGSWTTAIRLYGTLFYPSGWATAKYPSWNVWGLPQSTGFDYIQLYSIVNNTPTPYGNDVTFNFELTRNGSPGNYDFYFTIIWFGDSNA